MVRLATKRDIGAIMDVVASATELMDSSGVRQWVAGVYPTAIHITRDIDNEYGYVCEVNGNIVGYSAIIEGIEPTYIDICGGNWLTDKPYYTIHRVAVHASATRHGIAQKLFDFAKKLAHKHSCSVRVDTHSENKPMRALLTKNSFVYCGVIHVEDGTERVAYELDW